MDPYKISIQDVQIKGYHYFKIKALRETLLVIQSEDGNTYDPHALACLLPREMERILEALREVQIFSKSQRKTYTLEDVKGQQIGRVQHFLNTQLHGLLRCGKITRIEGEINGEPTLTSRPNSTQRFSRNKQVGGGAYIPAIIWVEGPQRYKEFCAEKNPLYSSRMRESIGHAC